MKKCKRKIKKCESYSIIFPINFYYLLLFYSEKAKEEFSKIKKQFLKELVRKNENETMKKLPTNSAVAEFAEETNKFREASGKIAKKGKGREEQVNFVIVYINLYRNKYFIFISVGMHCKSLKIVCKLVRNIQQIMKKKKL